MGKKVAFVLSGCGVKDGSEIHEAVAALIALDRAGYEVIFTAPDVEQTATVDHSTANPETFTRNALKESAPELPEGILFLFQSWGRMITMPCCSPEVSGLLLLSVLLRPMALNAL